MTNRKEHAEHNEKLCDILLGLKDYNDWVTTTAFYSALHYVQGKLFPLSKGGVTFKDFNAYYSTLSRPRNSRHDVNIQLVCRYISAIRSEYRSLFDICMNARYHNYVVSDGKANKARRHLTAIKSKCV